MTFEMLVDQETYPYPDSDMCEAWYFMDGLKTEMAKLKKKGEKWKGTRPTVKMARLRTMVAFSGLRASSKTVLMNPFWEPARFLGAIVIVDESR